MVLIPKRYLLILLQKDHWGMCEYVANRLSSPCRSVIGECRELNTLACGELNKRLTKRECGFDVRIGRKQTIFLLQKDHWRMQGNNKILACSGRTEQKAYQKETLSHNAARDLKHKY
jgi:hypothetical protein